MDGWSDRQIAFMKAGGNTRAKEWLERYNVKEIDLNNKYSSPALQAYRDKLKAIVENRSYVDPTPEEIAKQVSPYGSRTSSPALGSSSGGWGQPSANKNTSNMNRSGDSSWRGSSSGSPGAGGNGSYNGGGYNNGGYGGYNSPANSGREEQDMRTRFAGRNAIGSSDFEPQRPRGSPQTDGGDDIMNALYDGWSKFSTGMKQVAATAAEKVSSGQLSDEVSSLATRVAESQTWNYVTSLFSGDQAQQQSQQQRYMPPPTRDERAYSSDRPPPPRDDGGMNGNDPWQQHNGDPRGQPSRTQSAQPRQNGWGEQLDSSRPAGERQGLRYDSRDSQRRPQSTPNRTANSWSDNDASWDDWGDRKGDSRTTSANPAVAADDDEVLVTDYKPAVAAPQPTRVAPPADDIYDFQVAPTGSTPKPAGWDDWDDWGPKKK